MTAIPEKKIHAKGKAERNTVKKNLSVQRESEKETKRDRKIEKGIENYNFQ